MTTEQLTPEEQQLMSDMQADDAPEVDEQPQEPTQEPSEPQQQPEAQEDDDAPTTDGMVPHGALHKERERRKQIEREREEDRQQMAEMRRMLEEMRAAKQPEPAPEQPAEMPDPIMDPEGFRDYMRKQGEAQQQRWQEQERVQLQQQRLSRAASLEQEFASQTPDYGKATEFLHQNRMQELAAYGYSQQEAQQILGREANELFDRATAQGKNPAQVLYDLAKMRGYAGQQQTAQPDIAAQMQAKAAAQANTGTLATAGGPSTAGEMTIAQLAAMPDAEMAKWKNANPEKFAKLMGA